VIGQLNWELHWGIEAGIKMWVVYKATFNFPTLCQAEDARGSVFHQLGADISFSSIHIIWVKLIALYDRDCGTTSVYVERKFVVS